MLIWFHPGKFQEGGAVIQYWNPQYLIEHDIIVVTVNYRLGPFGKLIFILLLLLERQLFQQVKCYLYANFL